MARVLILTADIGAGHDLPAARLADALREHDCHVEVADSLQIVGGLLQWAIRDDIESRVLDQPHLYDISYHLLQRRRLRRSAPVLGVLLGGRALLDAIAAARADVVVSTYPGATELLGRMRAQGRLGVPLVSAITDLAALHYWAHPAVDLHLLIHPESAPEVRWIAGPDAPIAVVRGLSDPAFEHPPCARDARAALGLPADGHVVAVSGGGWGVGDLQGAVAVAREQAAGVVVLCGTNEPLRARMGDLLGGVPGAVVLGFTDRMPEVLSAADALIHSTAGLTVLEALVCGARPISYGWGMGHIAANNRAYVATGLASVAADKAALGAALAAALAAPRAPDTSYAARPSAASAVLSLTPD